MADQQHTSNAEAIADSKIPPGDDYEEIREQVRCCYVVLWMKTV